MWSQMDGAHDVEQVWSRVRTRFEADDLELPVFPRVAQEVMRIADDSSAGAGQLGRVVERDPGLCATVLRAASSAIYGPSVRVLSVNQAVTRLGFLEIRTIAVAAAVKSEFLSGGEYETELRECWRRAVSCGLIGKEVARVRRCGIDTAFLCGLFRHVGRMVAFSVCEREGQPPLHIARAIAREYEAGLSRRVAAQWELPPTVAAVLGDAAPEHRDAVDTCIVAERLLQALDDGHDSSAVVSSVEAQALGLYPDDIERLTDRLPAVLASVEAFS